MDDKNPAIPSGPKGRTTPFGDEFVRVQAADGTRPLRGLPTQNLDQEVRLKIDGIRQELDYVRHLTSLFAPPIAVLKAGLQLADLPVEGAGSKVPEEFLGKPCLACQQAIDGSDEVGLCLSCQATYHVRCWTGMCPISPDPAGGQGCGQSAFSPVEAPLDPAVAQVGTGLARPGLDLARAIADVLRADVKFKQRAHVCIFQYEEAYRAFQGASTALEQAERSPAHQAWESLNAIGIERIKGKAYAICGFYENFKTDPVLNQLFPPPRPTTAEPPPMNRRPADAQTRPLRPPAAGSPTGHPPAPPAQAGALRSGDVTGALLDTTGGMLGKIKSLFKKT